MRLGVVGNLPEVDGSGGATRRGGSGLTDNLAMEFGQSPPRLGARKGNQEVQGTHLEDPEPTRSPEGSQRRRRAAEGAKPPEQGRRGYGYAYGQLALD